MERDVTKFKGCYRRIACGDGVRCLWDCGVVWEKLLPSGLPEWSRNRLPLPPDAAEYRADAIRLGHDPRPICEPLASSALAALKQEPVSLKVDSCAFCDNLEFVITKKYPFPMLPDGFGYCSEYEKPVYTPHEGWDRRKYIPEWCRLEMSMP